MASTDGKISDEVVDLATGNIYAVKESHDPDAHAAVDPDLEGEVEKMERLKHVSTCCNMI